MMRTRSGFKAGVLSGVLMAGVTSAATYTVTNLTDVNFGGTLRWAINNANLGGVADTIQFDLPSPYVISPTGALPHLHNYPGTAIDGTTQPGYAGIPLVHLCGTGAPGSAHGLYINSDSNAVRGLVIRDFPFHGLYIDQGDGNVIEGCYIISNGQAGVWVYDGDRTRIGGTTANAGNVIGGGVYGIYLEGESADTVIQGNRIGTDPSGSMRYSIAEYGIHLNDSYNTHIGGTNPLARNIISGSDRHGITSGDGSGGSHVIEGNYIGTDVSGTVPISNLWSGISLGVPDCLIGGTNSASRNVISGNREGIFIAGTNASHTKIYGNYIGTDAIGASDMGNDFGVQIQAASQCEIGKKGAAGGNVISANRSGGISLFGGSYSNLIVNNYIGTDAAGTGILGNHSGISIAHSRSITVGGSFSERNIIAGNTSSGISSDYSTGLVVRSNYIGIDVNQAPMSNAEYGVRFRQVAEFDIGGTLGLHGNMIGNSGLDGINLSLCTNGYVRRNYVGLTGLSAAGNMRDGLQISGSAQLQLRDNTITSSGENGVYINQGVNLTLANNYIGTDSMGATGLGNAGKGIYITSLSLSNTIGGTDGMSGNIISGNGSSGIQLNGTEVQYTLIAGNKIGTDFSGTGALGNENIGVALSGSSFTMIGGTNTGAGNIISCNDGSGILIGGAGSCSNIVQGNIIGADVTGTLALPNTEGGIFLGSAVSNTLIGGTEGGAGNTIAFNRERGVLVYDGGAGTSKGNAILGNRIRRNESLGIDLAYDGVTPNDPQDPDPGENRLQNYPVLEGATNNGVLITVTGYLDSLPSTEFTIELFGNRDPDLSGYGEGEFLMGRTNVITPADGTIGFTAVVSVAAGTPNFITATVTALANNDTSEFSRDLLLDSDSDGMGDGYEVEYFGSPTGGNPAEDTDVDGISNLGEFLAETDPTDAASCLRITSIRREFGDWYFTIVASDTRNYNFQLNRDLAGNPAFNWWDWGSTVYSRTNGAATLRDGSGITTNFTAYRVRAVLP